MEYPPASNFKVDKGFSLIELLVVIAIIGILVTLSVGGFLSSQRRSRDVERKSDLKHLAEALELYFSDHKEYPNANPANGRLRACPALPDPGSVCQWGEGEFRDTSVGTIYMRTVPADPVDGRYYRYVVSVDNRAFQLFARLENDKDPDCIGGDCLAPPVSHQCGSNPGDECNFAVTSTNVSPLDSL